MHGDSHDRYERLTSVSSSVDFDQRDNVSALPPTSQPPSPPGQGGLAASSFWGYGVSGLGSVAFSARAVLVLEPQDNLPDPESWLFPPRILSGVSASKLAQA